ncbi:MULTISPECIES: hypothetical protein [Prochlorococcus]|uniref:S1 RNA binding domain-containing protein n=1 Tax=Prochlorococcus marinus (strain SARG / CCMP1375 / SS120) TaxID=167539 RepID=Q7VCZ5_PROMA|nr:MULTISPECIES: hypothetical protein [Prochlorococcus]AAP99639.1 Predicted protein [Prochlorococcus marinus subsp. marinus str. CCMP1375]KGG11089.1 putative S1 RNA binding domain-containing protein [Prochlorococcus marinus str. LG]KGG21427.1 putative S1 RNA binding domain-containing protein [Prochlorococcus marinus str. SS2]KGG23228.1 putative S1 RNA binding domain-containing protein [Prochlorococcus marinus str. SS35]KGG33939.1 putative S1 RNA binding domain-containing protein [Prochlorococc
MRHFLLALIFTAITFLSSGTAIADQGIEKKITKLENKVSKKFSKTFCNSTGFGISYEGALKFSLGETKGEFSKNPLIDKVDIENIKDQILADIPNTCYYFELAKSDLNELTLEKAQ